MRELIFKESFDWDRRFTNNEKPIKHSDEFYEGILIGVAVCVITGLAVLISRSFYRVSRLFLFF